MTKCLVRHRKYTVGSVDLWVVFLFSACCGGVHLSHNCKPRHIGKAERLLPQYQHYTFEYAGFQHEVYWRDPDGIDHPPAVLILHGGRKLLAGFSHSFLSAS